MQTNIPPIAFLGLTERAAFVYDSNTNLLKLNVLGLKQHFLSHLFPINFSSLDYLIAIHSSHLDAPIVLRIKNEEGAEVGSFTLQIEQRPAKATPSIEDLAVKRHGQTIQAVMDGWIVVPIPRPSGGSILINRPGLYSLVFEIEGKEVTSGQILFALVDPEPLSLSRIAAIKSNPNATKYVRFEFKCNGCNDGVKMYAGIERAPKTEEIGYTWYEDLPDSFACPCKKVEVDLSICRRNLHAFLGRPFTNSTDINLVPLYEKEGLTNIRHQFVGLLQSNSKEEVFQVFIEENPILLNRFSCQQILSKAPILTQYKTDFAVLTSNQELLLIELERPQTKLLKKKGHTHSELQHAVDQARQWLHLANEHRLAVLQCMGIEKEKVGSIRAVVIVGRDEGYNLEYLRELKGTDRGHIAFITYDDLVKGLDVLIENMSQL